MDGGIGVLPLGWRSKFYEVFGKRSRSSVQLGVAKFKRKGGPGTMLKDALGFFLSPKNW